MWNQDRPPAEKCTPWANDGGSGWNATRCSPVDPNPDGVGEPCTVEGSATSGIDSCEVGAMCWNVDAKTNMGICEPHCVGSENAPACSDPARLCSLLGAGVLILCLPVCEPLDPDACDDGLGCYPSEVGFSCAPDASGDGGGLFEPCEFANACDAGTLCRDADDGGLCEGGGVGSSCTPYCDLAAPSCPPQTDCAPYFGDIGVLPGWEDVGVCVAGEG